MKIKSAGWGIAVGLAWVSMTCLAEDKDELWEVSSKMDMAGRPFAMPLQAHKVCIPKGQEKDQNSSIPRQEDCQISDAKVSGNKKTWNMRCTGKNAMTGSGEMTFGTGTYSGKMKMHSENGDMTIVYDGKRIGNCDAAAEKAKVERQINESIEQACNNRIEATVKTAGETAGETAGQRPFSAKDPCAPRKADLCKKADAYAADYEGYALYAKKRGWLVTECGINLDKHRGALCQKSLADRKHAFVMENCPAQSKEMCQQLAGENKYPLVAKHCPAEAQALAKQHCEAWGRDYTSDHDNEYAPICAKYAKNKSRYEVADDEAEDEGKADAGSGKEGLIGKLFGGKPKGEAAKEEKGEGAGDNPAGAVLEGAKKLKGLLKF